jgi:osmoprotectant transport system ATP-binding protein
VWNAGLLPRASKDDAEMIKLEGVTKIYPDGTIAVQDISFEVKKGELCVLLGPSGCGKTTTMKMINRLIPVTSGKIYIDGMENTTIDENELRRNIGYTIQDIGLFPHMTVGENIETVPALKGWPKTKRRKRTKELLELLRMDPDEFIDKYPRELSGGQRQRIGVARSLGGDPPLLLMDEPFGAIDPITRVELQEEFLKLQQEIQKTIIFVTHDIYEAIKIGDQIALMKDGQLVQYAPPTELIYRPQNEFVAGFVGADRALKGLQLIRAKEIMAQSPPVAKPNEKAEAVRVRMERADTDLLAVVDDAGRFMGWVGAANIETNKRVQDIMTPATTTGSRTAVLNEALSLMLTSGLTVLAIVDNDNTLEGILTFQAIQQALSNEARKEGT